ncbi:MAG: 3-dehydroquinate synthase II [Candidatus Hodarchaeaceae archaeon]|nr:3-dehydroquinate synthase II [Candidatus Hodarchaeaceae archaeon]
MRRSIWVRADWVEPWEQRKRFVTAALEAGADAVVVQPSEAAVARGLGAITIVAGGPAPGVDVVMLSASTVADVERAVASARELREQGGKTAICVEIVDKELERAAVRAGRASDFIVAIGHDWKVIPLENLIAELHRANVKILAGVKDADEAKTAVGTLEIGADGVLLDPRERGPGEVRRVCEALESLAMEKLELVPARVVSARPVGMGDRACVDTCSLMTLGEGILVGSQADGMFLVHSESLVSKYVEPRPFRVNAGAVHAYVRLPEGKTKYLSELRAGDEVLLINARGEARVGIVGRVKIERRPLLLVEAEREGQVFKVLLQNAETINLVAKDGNPISVTSLRQGDEVLVRVERVGRHFGVKVAETIVER